MAPTSVIPFQHFLSPTSPVLQSPAGHASSVASGSPQISNAAALFSTPLFDDRFPHSRHHSTSSFVNHHHHHSDRHHSHNTPASPSTPRDSYNESARLNPPLTNGYSASSQNGHRWDPSRTVLDDVSRGVQGGGGGSGSSSISSSTQGFTLRPIVSIGTPRTSLAEWDSTSAQYAAAQWGAYSSSSASRGSMPYNNGAATNHTDSPSSTTTSPISSYGYGPVDPSSSSIAGGTGGMGTGAGGTGTNSPPSYAITNTTPSRYGTHPSVAQHHQSYGPYPSPYGPPPSQQQHQQSYGYGQSGSPVLGGGPAPAFLAHHQQAQQAQAHMMAVSVAQQGQGPGSDRSLPPLTSLVSPIGVNVSSGAAGRTSTPGGGPRPASASSSGRDHLSDDSVGSSSVASAYFAHAPPGQMYHASHHSGSGYSSHPRDLVSPMSTASSVAATNNTATSTTSSSSPPISNATTATNNNNSSGTPPLKPKRRRADANQLRTLNATYDRTAFPSTEERAELARKLGMTPRQVQIWFQNKRQSFRQTRTNNVHAVATAAVSVVHHSHHHQYPHHHLSSSSSGHISTQQTSSSYGSDGGLSGGPGTYGSIQLSSPPGVGGAAGTAAAGGTNNDGAGAGAYYSPADNRGGGDDDYGNDTSTSSRRYR